MSTEKFKFIGRNKVLNSSSIVCVSPSNIALIKYWGKYGIQLPKNASLSFTLKDCHTKTIFTYTPRQKRATSIDAINLQVWFEGELNEAFKPKIVSFFTKIQEYSSFIFDYDFKIETQNTFPHSSGIASSASGMSAIAIGLMQLEKLLVDTMSSNFFNQKASFLARLGSGSACRSIEGPIVTWGEHEAIEGSSNEYGSLFSKEIAPIFTNYQDTILLIDKGEKQVSSSVGHNLMHDHPFAAQRFAQANNNLTKLMKAMKLGDVPSFIAIVESEALSLHAMMMTSMPYFILMKPNTLEAINRIWAFRKNTKIPVCFTLDAGANVHVLYPEENKEAVLTFIKGDLAPLCQKNQYICDSVGLGASISS